jgi:phosphopantetheinyl transferase (holo-ACP synthase)
VIDLDGFALENEPAGDDPHAAGRRAATRALARFGAALAYDGTRPISDRPGIAVSIAHAGSLAVAIAGPAAGLGIDLVPDADLERLARLAPRYLARESALATTPEALAACFAAKEAGLKALGLGLLDGGMFDTCVVTVTSLDPPLLDPGDLRLSVGRISDATLAVVRLAQIAH